MIALQCKAAKFEFHVVDLSLVSGRGGRGQ
jgi:hypothetical protein